MTIDYVLVITTINLKVDGTMHSSRRRYDFPIIPFMVLSMGRGAGIRTILYFFQKSFDISRLQYEPRLQLVFPLPFSIYMSSILAFALHLSFTFAPFIQSFLAQLNSNILRQRIQRHSKITVPPRSKFWLIGAASRPLDSRWDEPAPREKKHAEAPVHQGRQRCQFFGEYLGS